MNIIRVKEVVSTNSFIRNWSDNHPEANETVVSTDNQTAGRGQRGNTWESEPGKNITMSLLLKPTWIAAEQQFILSQIVSLAIVETLAQHTEGIRIKWPNDIYYQDKKICGILIENDITDGMIGRSIIGIGLNVNQKIFHGNAPNPVSLSQITGKEYDLEEIISEIASGIVCKYDLLKSSAESFTNFQKKYAEYLYRKEGYHPFSTDEGEIFMARILRVEPSGLLVLEQERTGKTEAFAFKEIRFVVA